MDRFLVTSSSTVAIDGEICQLKANLNKLLSLSRLMNVVQQMYNLITMQMAKRGMSDSTHFLHFQ